MSDAANAFNLMMDEVRASHERAEDFAAHLRAMRIEFWRSCKCWKVDDAAHLAFGIVNREDLNKAKEFDLDYAMAAAEDALDDPVFAAHVAVSKLQEFRDDAARDGMSDRSAPAEWDAFFAAHGYPGLPQADASEGSDGPQADGGLAPSNQREKKGGQNSVESRRTRACYYEIRAEWFEWGRAIGPSEFDRRVRRKLAALLTSDPERCAPGERTIRDLWVPAWRKSIQSTG